VTLVDTSIWVSHFRRANGALMALLEEGAVLSHPVVIGELACGNLRRRAQVLAYLDALPRAEAAADRETLLLIEDRRLYGRGIGWPDAHLLASALISRCRLWTLDQPLAAAATAAGVALERGL
jgi:predicted nucleic acid-binding protein